MDVGELWKAYFESNRSDESRNRLAEHYLPWVKALCESYVRRLKSRVTYDEVVALSSLGLLQAIRTFSPERAERFEPYAQRVIYTRVLDQLRDEGWVPRSVTTRNTRAKRKLVELVTVLQRRPTTEEIESQCGQLFPVQVGSLFFECGSSDKVLLDTLGEWQSPQAEKEQSDFWKVVCSGLSKQDRLILLLYFREQLPLRVIASHVGLSESRLSQRWLQLRPVIRSKIESTYGRRALRTPIEYVAGCKRPRLQREDSAKANRCRNADRVSPRRVKTQKGHCQIPAELCR